MSQNIENKLQFTTGSNNMHVGGITRNVGFSTAGYFTNIDPGISVRPPTDRSVYEGFRPNETIPNAHTQEDYRKIMILCKSAYDRVGVIHSVIDMMSEFTAEGIEIIHEDEGPNQFYQAWSRKIKLEDRAERIANWLYKNGNCVVRRRYAKISPADLKKLSGTTVSITEKTGGGRIPIEYVIYDPATIELIGGSIGALSNKKRYGLRVPLNLLDGVRTPKNALEQEIYDNLPQEIKDALKGKTGEGMFVLPIPEDKIFVGHYKKDDSEIWAKSFIYSILDDVFFNDKLKLAKVSALDGYYNVLRIWKLGDHTTSPPVIPSPDAGSKLASILEQNTGGGPADVIWSSDIDVQEIYPPIDKLVNFEENIDGILMGLGVPDNLVGGETKNSSSSINFIGLKNLIKRLETGRRVLREWLEAEIDIIQKEMGFRKRPIIRFSYDDLHDERTYFDILIQLLDRNVISDKTILDRIGEYFDIEQGRVQKESKMRDTGEMPKKASPYHKPDLNEQQSHEIKKIREQGKIMIEKSGGDTENSSNMQKSVPKVPGKDGRPAGSKDTVSRTRRPNQKIKASFEEVLMDANRIYNDVDSFVKKYALQYYKVNNIRQLTSTQELELDTIKLNIFANIEPFSASDEDSIKTYIANPKVNEVFYATYDDILGQIAAENVNNEEKKILRTMAYAKSWVTND